MAIKRIFLAGLPAVFTFAAAVGASALPAKANTATAPASGQSSGGENQIST